MKQDLTPKYVLGMAIFLYLVISFAGGLAGAAFANYLRDGATAIALSVIVSDAVLVIIYYSMLKRSGLNCNRAIRSEDFILVILGVAAIILFDVAFASAMKYVSVGTPELEYWDRISSDGNIVVVCLATIIVAPVLEEILFRGIIFGVVKHYIGYKWALLLSSVVFGLAHGIDAYAVIGMASGLVLAIAYQVSGSLLVPIAIHMLNNLISQLETALLEDGLIFNFDSSALTVACIVLSLIVVAILITILSRASGKTTE